MKKMAILLATRGLVFTEVEEQIDNIQFLTDAIVLRTHNIKLPDAQNELVEKALMITDIEYLLFIEEDTVPPRDAIIDLLKANADIACIDYAINGWGCVTKSKKTNEILWCGLGCTLIKSKVFRSLEKPWFRTDKSFSLNEMKWIDIPNKYGGQDIWFCHKARENGFIIVQIPGECRHLQIQHLGKSEVNNGLHFIIEKPKITKHNYINI